MFILLAYYRKWQNHRFFKKHPLLQKLHVAYQKVYQKKNPYTLCREFFEILGFKDPFVYGETPFKVLGQIADAVSLKKDSLVVDLGSGTGLPLFFLEAVYGILGIGIDLVPEFTQKAKDIAIRLNLQERLQFITADLITYPIPKADVYYFAGTCFEEASLLPILEKLKKFPEALVVSTSFPLSDYSLGWEVIEILKGGFFWGETEVFIQKWGGIS